MNDFSGNKEDAFEVAIKAINSHGYIMTNDVRLTEFLEELEKDGLLLRADRAGDRNPVDDFNPEYTYIEA